MHCVLLLWVWQLKYRWSRDWGIQRWEAFVVSFCRKAPHPGQLEILFLFIKGYFLSGASLVAQSVKNPPTMLETWVGDLGLIPGLGRSPGEGKGYPLQYSGLENSMDSIVHRVAKSRTQLSDFHYTLNKWQISKKANASFIWILPGSLVTWLTWVLRNLNTFWAHIMYQVVF